MNKQYIIGIAGGLGVGKSTLSLEIKKYWDNKSLHIIELDDIRRYVLWSSTEKEHINLRKNLGQLFSFQTKHAEQWLNRETFTKTIFQSKAALKIYANVATPVLKKEIEKQIIENASSDIIISWAYLIEEGYYSFLNTPLILVHTPYERILERFSHNFIHFSMLDNEPNSLMQRLSIEPSYTSRIKYLESNKISFVSYNNNTSFSSDVIKSLIHEIKKDR